MNLGLYRRARAVASGAGEWWSKPAWSDLGAWLLAFATAIGLWLFVNTGERTSERTVRIRLEPQDLPAGMVITNPIAEYAELRVSGPGIILSGIDPSKLQPLDLSGVRPGLVTYPLNANLFQLPQKVEVIRVTPSQVSFHVDRIAKRAVAVRIEKHGEPAPGTAVTELDVAPDKVEVVGAQSRLEGLRGITTEPLNVDTLPMGSSTLTLKLISPGEQLQLGRTEVKVRAQVSPITVEREFHGLPIAMRGDDVGWRADPVTVSLTVRGPDAELRKLAFGPGSVYVDAAGLDAPGPYRVRPMVDLPPGIELVRRDPQEIVLQAPPVVKKRAGRAPGRKVEKSRE
jgi:YbbR domain-containing protein